MSPQKGDGSRNNVTRLISADALGCMLQWDIVVDLDVPKVKRGIQNNTAAGHPWTDFAFLEEKAGKNKTKVADPDRVKLKEPAKLDVRNLPKAEAKPLRGRLRRVFFWVVLSL